MLATTKSLSRSRTPPSRTPSLAGISASCSSTQFVKAKQRLTSSTSRKQASLSDARYDEVTIERLISRSELVGECFVVPPNATNGYASVQYRRKTVTVHRLVYTLFIGPVPEGLHIDHVKPRCKHRSCWRPSHLEAVTQQENNRRTRVEVCRKGIHPMTGDNLLLEGKSRRCKACRNQWSLQKVGKKVYR